MSKNPRHVAAPLNELLAFLPQEQREKFLVGRRIKQVQDQFAACVDPYILDHVNSVYLTKVETEDVEEGIAVQENDRSDKNSTSDDVSRETLYNLTVFVDNSIVAAELNAQRELVVLKFRELFSVKIDTFSIKISRGQYLRNHPFRKKDEDEKQAFHPLTTEEDDAIRKMTASIGDPEIRASFQRVLKAIKEHPSEN